MMHVICTTKSAGQRIQLKASLEGVTFAPAPEAMPSSSSSNKGTTQDALPVAQPGKIEKVCSHVGSVLLLSAWRCRVMQH